MQLYKHITDYNLNQKICRIEIPRIFSAIELDVNKKLYKEMYNRFIKEEEYEYANKLKTLIN